MRIEERLIYGTRDVLDSVTICAAKVMRGGSLVYCPSFKSGPKLDMKGQERETCLEITLKQQKCLKRCTISEEVGVHNRSDVVK